MPSAAVQKSLAAQFMSITGARDKDAQRVSHGGALSVLRYGADLSCIASQSYELELRGGMR